ncbi:MAG: DUF1080 domain-containing protein, partial [Verrucomicrobiota bacterium]
MQITRKTLAFLLALPFAGSVVVAETVHTPFNGRNLDNWEVKKQKQGSKWMVKTPKMSEKNPKTFDVSDGEPAMVNLVTGHRQSVDIYTKDKYGSCLIEVELMVPKGANSGVYVMGEYEVQVLDSYGKKKLGGGDMGAIYGAAPPAANGCREPGEWQKYVI